MFCTMFVKIIASPAQVHGSTIMDEELFNLFDKLKKFQKAIKFISHF